MLIAFPSAMKSLSKLCPHTICRLTEDKEIIALTKHVGYLAGDSMNEVNAAMEQVGAHYE